MKKKIFLFLWVVVFKIDNKFSDELKPIIQLKNNNNIVNNEKFIINNCYLTIKYLFFKKNLLDYILSHSYVFFLWFTLGEIFFIIIYNPLTQNIHDFNKKTFIFIIVCCLILSLLISYNLFLQLEKYLSFKDKKNKMLDKTQLFYRQLESQIMTRFFPIFQQENSTINTETKDYSLLEKSLEEKSLYLKKIENYMENNKYNFYKNYYISQKQLKQYQHMKTNIFFFQKDKFIINFINFLLFLINSTITLGSIKYFEKNIMKISIYKILLLIMIFLFYGLYQLNQLITIKTTYIIIIMLINLLFIPALMYIVFKFNINIFLYIGIWISFAIINKKIILSIINFFNNKKFSGIYYNEINSLFVDLMYFLNDNPKIYNTLIKNPKSVKYVDIKYEENQNSYILFIKNQLFYR